VSPILQIARQEGILIQVWLTTKSLKYSLNAFKLTKLKAKSFSPW
jgi:hypothetical protein